MEDADEKKADLLTSCKMNWKQIFLQETQLHPNYCCSISIPIAAAELPALITSLIKSYLLGAIQFVRKRHKLCLCGTAQSAAIALHGHAVHQDKAGTEQGREKRRQVGRAGKHLLFMHMCGRNFIL